VVEFVSPNKQNLSISKDHYNIINTYSGYVIIISFFLNCRLEKVSQLSRVLLERFAEGYEE